MRLHQGLTRWVSRWFDLSYGTVITVVSVVGLLVAAVIGNGRAGTVAPPAK